MSNINMIQFPNSIDLDRNRYAEIDSSISEIEKRLIEISDDIEIKNSKLDDVSRALVEVEARRERVESSLVHVRGNIDSLKAESSDLKAIDVDSISDEKKIINHLEELSVLIDESVNERRVLNEEFSDIKREEKNLNGEKVKLINELKILQDSALSLSEQVKRYNNEKGVLSKKIVDAALQQSASIQRQLESSELQRIHEQSQIKEMNENFYRRENELNNREKKLIENENKLSSSFDERLRDLQKREAGVRDREKETEDYIRAQREEFDVLRVKAQEEIRDLHNQAKKMEEEISINKERQTIEYQKQLEKNTAKYINETLQALNLSYKDAKKSASEWRFYGAISLVLAFGALFYLSYLIDPLDVSLDWKNISYLSIRGSAIIALAGAFATYAVKCSNRLSIEAAEIASRVHGIEYGAFFINTYGANAGWDEINDAFRHWHKDDENKKIKK